MVKTDILTYLETRLEKELGSYDFALDWDKRNYTIEILIRLFAENNGQLTIDDVEGVASEEEVIEFEDGILLYDKNKSMIDSANFFATIPFDSKKGIQKMELDGLAVYLKEVLDHGQSDLLAFLAPDSEMETFELHFEKADFEKAIQANESKAGDAVIAYPKF